MSTIYNAIIAFADWAWGIPMLIWLVGGGIVLTIAIGGLQFLKLPYCIKNTLIKGLKEKKEGEGISGLQCVLSALSGTIGTGNIVGVAAGIAYGGPGAVFWIWVIGCLAMGIKYCEALCGVKFREPAGEGGAYLYNAGPSVYMRKGIKWKPLGTALAAIWGVSAIWALTMSGAEHTAAVTDALQVAFNVPKLASIIFCCIVVGGVMLGGMKRFVKFSELVVPVMALVYIGFGLVILVMNITAIPGVIALIFKSAFTGHAAVGGFAGATIAQAIRWGTARGMYSSDSGTGIAAIMHGQADTQHPAEQGMYGVLEVFIDTIVVCTFSALIILSTGAWTNPADASASFALMAFQQELGIVGATVETLCIGIFALTSAVGMGMYVGRHVGALLGKKVSIPFQVLYVVLMVAGGYVGFDALIPFTDMFCALEIFINMTGLVLMFNVIRETTKDYFENHVKKEVKQ